MWQSLAGVLYSVSGNIAVRVLASLGFSIASFAGVNALLNKFKAEIISSFSGFPADAVQLLAMCGFFVAVNIIFQAFLIKLTIRGLSSDGTIKTLLFGGSK